MNNRLGTVASLWRYPVKSMLGEEIDATLITERGLLGDRAYAVLDCATGYIATAKHPRKWQALLACRARYAAPPSPSAPLPLVEITLPDGASIRSTQPDADQRLSQALGHEVRLIAAPPAQLLREANRTPTDDATTPEVINVEPMAHAAPEGTFFDYAVLHIITAATLARLRELYPSGDVAVQRFRPNIVVETAASVADFVENAWLDKLLALGGARVYVLDPCPRCVVTTLAHGDLPRDPEVLRTVAQHNTAASVTLAPGTLLPAVAGVYGRVQQAGPLRCGDVVARVSAVG